MSFTLGLSYSTIAFKVSIVVDESGSITTSLSRVAMNHPSPFHHQLILTRGLERQNPFGAGTSEPVGGRSLAEKAKLTMMLAKTDLY
jgi:hypothetical protein